MGFDSMVVNGTKQGLKTISHSNLCGMGIEPPIDGDHRAGVSYRTMPLSQIVCLPETAHGDCSSLVGGELLRMGRLRSRWGMHFLSFS